MAAPYSQRNAGMDRPATTNSSISLPGSPYDPSSDPDIRTRRDIPMPASMLESSRSLVDRGIFTRCPECGHHFKVPYRESGSSSVQVEPGTSIAPENHPNLGTRINRPSLSIPVCGAPPLEGMTKANSPGGQESSSRVHESGDGNLSPTVSVSQSEVQHSESIQRTLLPSAAHSTDPPSGVQESPEGGHGQHRIIGPETTQPSNQRESVSNPHPSTLGIAKAGSSGPHPTATGCAQESSRRGLLGVSNHPPPAAIPQPERRSAGIRYKTTKLFKSIKRRTKYIKRQADRPFRWVYSRFQSELPSFMRAEEHHAGEIPQAEIGSGPTRTSLRVEGTPALQRLGQDRGNRGSMHGNTQSSSSIPPPPVGAEPTQDQDLQALPERIHVGEDCDVPHQLPVNDNPETGAPREARPALSQTTQGEEYHLALYTSSRSETLEASGIPPAPPRSSNLNRDMSQHGVALRRRRTKMRDIRQRVQNWVRNVYNPVLSNRTEGQQNGETPSSTMTRAYTPQPDPPLPFRHTTGGQNYTYPIPTINGDAYAGHD